MDSATPGPRPKVLENEDRHGIKSFLSTSTSPTVTDYRVVDDSDSAQSSKKPAQSDGQSSGSGPKNQNITGDTRELDEKQVHGPDDDNSRQYHEPQDKERAAKRKAVEDQTDLLLDLAMNTAFASLLDGTPIESWSSLFSFASLFVLIWWVWASQVLYHARFRENDWVHIVLYFTLQLAVFMSFTIFTSNFAVEDGIVNDNTDDDLAALRKQEGWTILAIMAERTQSLRIPVQSMRGISMTMAMSRLMILIEYLCAVRRLLYDPEFDKMNVLNSNPNVQPTGQHKGLWYRLTNFKQKELIYYHCGSIFISFWFYIAAFIVIGKHPTRGDQIARICLWYPPVILEVASHFVVASKVQEVEWNFKAVPVHERRSVIFTIILGAGLDRMTDNFHFMVANLSFNTHRILTIICAGLTIIFLFTLHFTNASNPLSETSCTHAHNKVYLRRRRVLVSFILNFAYLCALVVTLQGMVGILKIGDIGDAMEPALDFMRQAEGLLNATNFTTPLKPSFFDGLTAQKLDKVGFNITEVVAGINTFIPSPFPDDTSFPFKMALLADMDIIGSGLRAINIIPQDNSISSNKIHAFLDSAFARDNASVKVLNKPLFVDAAQTALTDNTAPSSWFTVAGGVVLVLLAIIECIDHWHMLKHMLPEFVLSAHHVERKQEARLNGKLRHAKILTFQVMGKLLIGVVLILFSALSNHGDQVQLDGSYRFVGSRIWNLAINSWLLPIYVLILFELQCYEYALLIWLHHTFVIGGQPQTEIKP